VSRWQEGGRGVPGRRRDVRFVYVGGFEGGPGSLSFMPTERVSPEPVEPMSAATHAAPAAATMRAAVCRRYGPPDVVELTDVAKPIPRDNEILIRVRATTVNSTCLQAHILHAEPETLHQAEPSAVQQHGDEPGCPLKVTKEASYLVAAQHRGQAAGPFRSHQPVQPGRIPSQALPIEEEERRQGLVLGRGTHPLLDREMVQEPGDFLLSQFHRMADPVKSDAAPDPCHVGSFGRGAIAPRPERIANLVEQLRSGHGVRGAAVRYLLGGIRGAGAECILNAPGPEG